MSEKKIPLCPIKPFERVMVFIDGGYLRGLHKQYYKHDKIDFGKFFQTIHRMYATIPSYPFQLNLLGIYYYDAIVDVREHPRIYAKQLAYFERELMNRMWYIVRLGKLVKTPKQDLKQKGVDILMAIDAVSKAYQNQYDMAIFVVGDADFVPLIEAVKNAGKKTILIYHQEHVTFGLKHSAHMNIGFNTDAMKDWSK
jgi:uncharacterized LabA/DUF88 family protein